MARRRRHNVSTTWIVAGSAGALALAGGIAYAVHQIRRTQVTPTQPGPLACPPGAHVGAPGFSWPHPEIFVDSGGFGEALEALGYDAGDWQSDDWSVCGQSAQQAIEEFQREYNVVRVTVDEPVTDELEPTGLLDEATVRALAYAITLRDEFGLDWPLLVYEATGGADVS